MFSASPASGITIGDIDNWNSSIQPSDLAPVATSGSYGDLTDTPILGTAAEADAGDFATAAQGALAGTSTQPGDNISTLTNDSGYLSAETDPVYSASPAAGITTANINAWDSALQSGDNISSLINDAGYLTSTIGFSGSFATATDTITVVDGLITAVTPL